jgi:hypothetical protein
MITEQTISIFFVQIQSATSVIVTLPPLLRPLHHSLRSHVKCHQIKWNQINLVESGCLTSKFSLVIGYLVLE